jgi:long-chain acyl-CoA synthetase
MYLTQTLHRASQQTPEATATVCGGRRHTFAQLQARVERLAAGLLSLGLGRGDRVAMLAHNSDRYLEYYLATYWAGLVVNPVNTRWSVGEIAYSLNDSGTRVLIVDDAHLPAVAQLRNDSAGVQTVIHAGESNAPSGTTSFESLIESSGPAPDAMRGDGDIAGIFYTGGTTGFPKGVMLSHLNLYVNALALVAEGAISKAGVGLHAAPMFHIADICFMKGLLMRGATHVVLPGFEPVSVFKSIAAEQVTDCLFVPTMIQMLVDHPARESHDIGSVRHMMYGASPIDEALLDRALRAFPQAAFFQGYGMTELAAIATLLPPECHVGEHRARGKLRSAGRAAVCSELLVLDQDRQPAPTNTIGEIVVRGPGTMLGYWNKPAETAEALRDGWMHTGDLGYLDAEGFLYVVDRLKDMIVTGGENVYSAEVENAVLKHPSVAMCAIIGVPDPSWGERVHAVLVLRAGTDPFDLETLRSHARQYIAGYKCPRSMELRSELPLSGAGKVLKKVLREPYWMNRSREVS